MSSGRLQMEALSCNIPKLERVCLSGQDATAEEEGGRSLRSIVVCEDALFLSLLAGWGCWDLSPFRFLCPHFGGS